MIYICSLPNPGIEGVPRELFYADDAAGYAKAEAFLAREDKQPGRGIYCCIGKLRDGARSPCKDEVVELDHLVVDLDLKNIAQTRDEVLLCLQRLVLPPSEIRDSGFGLHAVWVLKEPADDEAGMAQAEAIMKQLVELLAGDPAPTHRAALLRVPGSHNTKNGTPRRCHAVWRSDARYDVSEFADMFDLYGDRPKLDRKEAPKSNGHSPDDFEDAPANGKADVDALMASMTKGNCNDVQKSVIPALLWRGWHPDEIADYLISATVKVWGGDRAQHTKAVTGRVRAAIKNLFMKEYDHTAGAIPPWLAAEFHDEWADVLVRNQRPELHYSRGKWSVRAVGTTAKGDAAAAEQPQSSPIIPLTVAEWLARDLPPPDRLLGAWFTTTSRILLSADTGLGRTNLGMTVAVHMGAGVDFLHWQAYRPARVLYIDGEMSRRLYRDRIVDVVRRLGVTPPNVLFLSREDVEDFAPLNTPKGAAWLNQLLERIGPVDAIIFDNIMALLDGDMKEEEGWTRILPLVNSLTKRCVGQLWINHTGHDATRSYGSKTKDWRMDTVMHLVEVERADTDLSFALEFHKARERTPDNRADFEEVTIALVDDQWTSNSGAVRPKGKPSAQEISVLEVLNKVLAGADAKTVRGRRAAPTKPWCDECVRRALVKGEDAFRSCRSRLAQKRLVECEGEWSWIS